MTHLLCNHRRSPLRPPLPVVSDDEPTRVVCAPRWLGRDPDATEVLEATKVVKPRRRRELAQVVRSPRWHEARAFEDAPTRLLRRGGGPTAPGTQACEAGRFVRTSGTLDLVVGTSAIFLVLFVWSFDPLAVLTHGVVLGALGLGAVRRLRPLHK